MTYLLWGLIAAWLCGLRLLALINARDADTVVLHIAPDKQTQKQERATGSAEARTVGVATAWSLEALFIGPGLAVIEFVFRRIFNLDGSGATRATRIDPARLTEAGHPHLARAIRNERITYVWMAAGGVLLTYAGYYFTT